MIKDKIKEWIISFLRENKIMDMNGISESVLTGIKSNIENEMTVMDDCSGFKVTGKYVRHLSSIIGQATITDSMGEDYTIRFEVDENLKTTVWEDSPLMLVLRKEL